MQLKEADIVFFNDISVDYIYILFGKHRVQRNRKLSLFNQVKSHLKIKYKDKYPLFEVYIREKYNIPPVTRIPESICQEWENSLMRYMKPNFYGELFRIKQKNKTKLEIYALVDDNVLEKICDSGTSMYREIQEYCQFWTRANDFCLQHDISSPVDLPLKSIKEEFRTALLTDKIIKSVDDIQVLRNDHNGYCLAYYDLDSGDLSVPTLAWDSFLAQMVSDGCRELFRAWVYSVFKGDNFGRQVLWLHGVGESGKSVIINTIYERLQKLNPLIVTTLEQINNMDKFSMSTYVQKRFAMSADTKDRALVRNGLVKNLTGTDIASSRSMGKAKEDAKVHCKLMVTSNTTPFVNTDSPEEISRLLLISLVPEQCVVAKNAWFEREIGDWQNCLRDEIDDFIRQSKVCYDKLLKKDNHNLNAYDEHEDVLAGTAYHIKRDIPLWWESCVEKTDDPNDTLQTYDLAMDYIRFIKSELKTGFNIEWRIRSFMMTFIRESKIPVTELTNFNVLLIRGYKFIKRDPAKRMTAKELIVDMIREDNAKSKV